MAAPARDDAPAEAARGIRSELSRILQNSPLASMAREVGFAEPPASSQPAASTPHAAAARTHPSATLPSSPLTPHHAHGPMPTTPLSARGAPAHAALSPSPAKRKIDVQSPDDEGRRRRARGGAAADKGGKGLRHFSWQVCQKVREKGLTTYNEVADELVREHQGMEDLGGDGEEEGGELHGPKNIRRRVYDALNVLMAMGIIAKERKEIRWIGLPTSAAQQAARLADDRRALAARIAEKRRRLHDLMLQQIAFKSLLRRNERLAAEEAALGSTEGEPRIQLPFVLVQTARDTVIRCQMTEDKSEYVFDFSQPFSIHDDTEVLRRLGLALGLDAGTATEEQMAEARALVPQALQHHVAEINEQRRRERLHHAASTAAASPAHS